MHSQNHLQPIAVRSVRASQFNFNDKKLNVSGYVNETGKPSDPIPNWGETDQIPEDESFVEVMQPGVFRDAIQNADFVDFYMEHDPDKYLSSTREGTLNLTEDNTGLKMSANIVPTSWGQDTYTLIKSGAIKSMSFGFVPIDAEWDLSGVTPVRTVTKIQLLEVSAVRFPAYPDSSIDARRKHFKRLNQMLAKRGFTLSNLKHKRGVNTMSEKVVKNKGTRAMNGGSNPQMMTSTDAQNLTTAINNMTNAIQENSEVQSNIAAKIMQAANGDRAKKGVHDKKSKKRDGEAKKPAEKKPAKDPKPKGDKKPKEDPKNKKEDPKGDKPKEDPKPKADPKPDKKSEDEKRAEKAKLEKQAKRAKQVNSMIKAMQGFDEKV